MKATQARRNGLAPRRRALLARTVSAAAWLTVIAPSAAHAEAEVPEERAAVVLSGAPALPPLRTVFLQYGVAFTGEFVASAGAMCTKGDPCVLGSGGGVVARVGLRTAGPWYLGGAYEMTKQDAQNLYRLGTLQQLRAELRYYISTGKITQPFFAVGGGVAGYGNEWTVETKGPAIFAAIGAETQLSRTNVFAFALTYRAMYFTPFTISGLTPRDGSIAHMLAIDIGLDILDPR